MKKSNYLKKNIAALLCFLAFQTSAQSLDLSFFVGKWNLELWFTANKTGTADITALYTVAKPFSNTSALSGYVTIDSVTTQEMVGWNAFKNELVRNIITSDGSYITFTSKGWNNNKIEWLGTQYRQGGKTDLKEVITRIDTDCFEAVFFMLADKKWTQISHEKLKRIKNG